MGDSAPPPPVNVWAARAAAAKEVRREEVTVDKQVQPQQKRQEQQQRPQAVLQQVEGNKTPALEASVQTTHAVSKDPKPFAWKKVDQVKPVPVPLATLQGGGGGQVGSEKAMQTSSGTLEEQQEAGDYISEKLRVQSVRDHPRFVWHWFAVHCFPATHCYSKIFPMHCCEVLAMYDTHCGNNFTGVCWFHRGAQGACCQRDFTTDVCSHNISKVREPVALSSLAHGPLSTAENCGLSSYLLASYNFCGNNSCSNDTLLAKKTNTCPFSRPPCPVTGKRTSQYS